MTKSCLYAPLVFHVLAVPAFAQEAQKPHQPAKRLPAVNKAWGNAEKKVLKNREAYDDANAKALESFQKEIEKIKPPVDVEELVKQFQQEAIVALDANAKPRALPPPEQGVVEFNGHKYRLVEKRLSWEDAKKECEQMGGSLLVIDDRNEQAFIHQALNNFIAQNPAFPEGHSVWLGISTNNKNAWINQAGQEQRYFNWERHEPVLKCTHAHLVPGGGWGTNIGQAGNIFFICEWANKK